jgi:2-polyprenyl-3-methyl-5-hydroxy-6-metoxy-1,4-benzoquinol methylase
MNKNIQFELYNDAYRKFTPDWASTENMIKIDSEIDLKHSTLMDFTEMIIHHFEIEYKLSEFDLLEIGCGIGALSLALQDRFKSTTAIDISSIAIATAREVAKLKNKLINFLQVDITQTPNLEKKFNLIIDSHLLHCLTDRDSRQKYFAFLRNHLSVNGRAIIETMTFHKGIQIPIGYEFTIDNILHKNIKDSLYPVRAIFDSITIENEIKECGLKIDYLYYHNELSFDVFDDYKNYPIEYLPKTLRISLSLG